jgi:hypothetical protein
MEEQKRRRLSFRRGAMRSERARASLALTLTASFLALRILASADAALTLVLPMVSDVLWFVGRKGEKCVWRFGEREGERRGGARARGCLQAA